MVKFNRQTQKSDFFHTRPKFDAKYGRVWLAIERLEEYSKLFEDNGLIIATKAIILLEYLGKGMEFKKYCPKALELLVNNNQRNNEIIKILLFNALLLSSNENEFKKNIITARYNKVPNEMLYSVEAIFKSNFDKKRPFFNYQFDLLKIIPPEKVGEQAALIEVMIDSYGENIISDAVDQLRIMRIECLRNLDKQSESILKASGYRFAPDDRLTLKIAVNEFESLLKNSSRFSFDIRSYFNLSFWFLNLENFQKALHYVDEGLKINQTDFHLLVL
ncbi:MAG: hypothetical protein ACFFBD_28005, partial [Candidatus Hodarchaeota archaeon]